MTTSDEFDKFKKNIDKNNLDIPDKETEETLDQALKEGNAMLEAEEAAKNAVTPCNNIVLTTSVITTPTEKNVYKRAHDQLIAKWLKNGKIAWRAKEVMEMEAGTIPKDYHYDEFVKEVAILGDSL